MGAGGGPDELKIKIQGPTNVAAFPAKPHRQMLWWRGQVLSSLRHAEGRTRRLVVMVDKDDRPVDRANPLPTARSE